MLAIQRRDAEEAIEEINRGLSAIRHAFVDLDAEEAADENELFRQLVELKEMLREEYQIGPTLHEQLAEAVADEQYERAARLRDRLRHRDD